MRRPARSVQGAHFRRHQSLVAMAEAGEQRIARLRVDDPEATQRLHMDENVLGAFAAREEAKAPVPVEPFDDDDLKAADAVDRGARPLRLGPVAIGR